MAATFYVWRRPLDLTQKLDHTWVTTYTPVAVCPPDMNQGDYWYCWGVCHETGEGTDASLLRSGSGDLEMARRINAPNDDSAHAGIPGFYGEYGVCHQVANRTLFPTADPLTVQGAKGAWLSYLLYGPYGGPDGNWEQTIQQCGLAEEAAMSKNDFDKELLAEALGPDPEPSKVKQFEAVAARLRAEKEKLSQEVRAGNLSVEDFAHAVNELLTNALPELTGLVGDEKAVSVFGSKPGDKVVLLDPGVARSEDKKSGPDK